MYSKDETKALKLEFWEKLSNRTRRLPKQKGKKKIWIFDNTGIKGVDLRFDADRTKAQVALEINHKNDNKRIELFEKLHACKSFFYAQFGENLIWDYCYIKESGEQVCRVYVEQPCDILNKETWSKTIYFLIDNMLKLEKVFLEVKDYLISGMNKNE
ncbi:MAG: DUF4268 domain-containing protein [Marinilabiliaceae bacterium]|nr:DUF4268 domain-containing protein [Marinilabiliaceae bacterium]